MRGLSPAAVIASASLLFFVGCDSESGEADSSHRISSEVSSRWKCEHCDEWHDDLPFSYGPKFPDLYFSIPEDERESRVQASGDFCIIDGKDFFVRGRLEIPVIDSEEIFSWDVWVSLSEKNFRRTEKLLETGDRADEEPYFGWLSTSLHLYPDTLHLKALAHTREVGLVPLIELEPTGHPLAIEQREGITLKRVTEIAALILHPEAGGAE